MTFTASPSRHLTLSIITWPSFSLCHTAILWILFSPFVISVFAPLPPIPLPHESPLVTCSHRRSRLANLTLLVHIHSPCCYSVVVHASETICPLRYITQHHSSPSPWDYLPIVFLSPPTAGSPTPSSGQHLSISSSSSSRASIWPLPYHVAAGGLEPVSSSLARGGAGCATPPAFPFSFGASGWLALSATFRVRSLTWSFSISSHYSFCVSFQACPGNFS